MAITSVNSFSTEAIQATQNSLAGQLVKAAKSGGVNDPRFMEELQRASKISTNIGIESGASMTPVTIGHQTQAPTFGQMMAQGVKSLDAKDKVYQNELQKVLSGESDNVHRAMLAQKELDMYMKLGKVVQRSLVEGWQELMKTQV